MYIPDGRVTIHHKGTPQMCMCVIYVLEHTHHSLYLEKKKKDCSQHSS